MLCLTSHCLGAYVLNMKLYSRAPIKILQDLFTIIHVQEVKQNQDLCIIIHTARTTPYYKRNYLSAKVSKQLHRLSCRKWDKWPLVVMWLAKQAKISTSKGWGGRNIGYRRPGPSSSTYTATFSNAWERSLRSTVCMHVWVKCHITYGLLGTSIHSDTRCHM